jgi:hypothetical protein
LAGQARAEVAEQAGDVHLADAGLLADPGPGYAAVEEHEQDLLLTWVQLAVPGVILPGGPPSAQKGYRRALAGQRGCGGSPAAGNRSPGDSDQGLGRT